jgi:hypothetical protein
MKTSLKWLSLFLFLFLLLRYVANFSDRQSLLLAFIAVGLHSGLAQLQPRKQRPFVPYSVFVRPKFRAILKDFDLINDTDENWAKLSREIQHLPKQPWNIWESGLSISFLTPQLKYRRAWNDFVTTVDVHASLEPVFTLREGLNREPNPNIDSPSLRLLPGNYGYRLILELRDWYWDKIKQKEAIKSIPESNVSRDQICGSMQVAIAVIPYQEFDVHFWAEPDEPFEKLKKVFQTRAQARSRFGWQGQPQRDGYGRETSADSSNEVEHRYFTLTHSAL